MSQILKPEDSKWYSTEPYNFRKLYLEIKKIETEKQIEWYSINTRLEIITDSEIKYNTFENFFKVYYSISWSYKKFFDIDRKTKKYEHYSDNRLFNFASVKVSFNKENKSKIKAKIKRILENEIKADMVFYENNQTIQKPDYFDYSEKSDNLEKSLEALS